MAITTAQQKENLAIAYGAAATYASLHTADPGSTGTSEVTGGSPAYARKAITWTGGSVDGVVVAACTFDIPSSTTVTYAGLFTAVTAGTFLDKVAVTYNSQPSQGQLTVNFTYIQS